MDLTIKRMKNRHLASRSKLRRYKDKYVSLKDIYNTIKSSVRIKSERGSRMLDYSEYYSIVEAYLDESIKMLAKEQEIVKLPNKLGSLYLKNLPHRRAFHVRLDQKASEEKGEAVYYKVPILDDEYIKVMWDRPYRYGKYKVLPLKRFKELINKNK